MKVIRKSKRNQRTRKQRMLMYGGAPSPAPAPGFNIFNTYSATDVQSSLNNFLQAAYSVYQAAIAIKATSTNQNNNTTDSTRGTRYLQIDSANSFQTATTTIQNSLNNLYMQLAQTSTSPTLIPASAPPPLGWAPPPQTYT